MTICDFCLGNVDVFPTKLQIQIDDKDARSESFDLCQKCRKEFPKYIDKFVSDSLAKRPKSNVGLDPGQIAQVKTVYEESAKNRPNV